MAQPTNNTTTEDSPKPKSKILLFVILGLVISLGGAGAAWFFFVHGKSAQAAQKTEASEKKEPEFTVHLDSFTVNLADQEESHFLRVTMELGLGHEPKGGGAKEGADTSGIPVAQTRDTILSILSACKANDLLTPEGKVTLKQHLLAALHEKVPEIDARNVYFTEFLVQR
jgi:flagellar FliL protein